MRIPGNLSASHDAVRARPSQLSACAPERAAVRLLWGAAAGVAHANPGGGSVLRRMLPTLHIRVVAEAGRAFDQHKSRRKRQMTAKTLRFSQLSASRQALVRLCQDVNFGQIQGLHVRNSDPVWDPTPTVLLEVRLDIEEGPRPEGELPDFKLSSEIQRLMCQLDQLKDGRIEKIEVRGGVPRRLVLASRLA